MGVWTSAWASARIAIRALRVNKLRSALTMLGIVIGVGAVITMVAVGAGAQARVAEQIQSLGSNMIIVLSGSILSGGVRMGSSSQLTITEDDAWAKQREIPAVAAGGAHPRGGAQVVYGNLNWATGIRASRSSSSPHGSGTWPTGACSARRRSRGGQGGARRPHRGGQPRRQRPARPGDPDQERAVHGHPARSSARGRPRSARIRTTRC
jgi:hypothetical protein